jgi:hypothetical protein
MIKDLKETERQRFKINNEALRETRSTHIETYKKERILTKLVLIIVKHLVQGQK